MESLNFIKTKMATPDCSKDKYALDAIATEIPDLQPVVKTILDWYMLVHQTTSPSPLEHTIDPSIIDRVHAELLRLYEQGIIDQMKVEKILSVLRYLIHKFSERVQFHYERAEAYDQVTAQLSRIFNDFYLPNAEIVEEG